MIESLFVFECLLILYVDIDTPLMQIRNAMRLDVVYLMLATIEHAAPNLAHLMLGFELSKPISKTVLQDPGTPQL